MKKFNRFAKVFVAVMMVWCEGVGRADTAVIYGIEWNYTLTDGKATITSASLSGDVVIPNTLGGYPVMSIGGSAFKGCSGLTSITIPEGVTSIGDYAFYYCRSLTSITIPDSVTSIGDWAFNGCAGLTSITIPDSVTSIGDSAFSHCSGLTSITIPDGVTSIGDRAFEGCSGLTSIVASPDNPNYSSEDGVLFNKDKTKLICCSARKSGAYMIPDGVTSIGDSAFSDCSGLTSITIPDSVTSIGDRAFSYCSGLTSITISDSVTSIGDSAFSHCSGLTSITIPDGVTSIGGGAFSYCSGLTSIVVSPDNPNYSSEDGVLFNKDKTKLICCLGGKSGAYTIPDSVTSIGNRAFVGCSGLTSITISDSVTSIGLYAFYDCSSLTTITIPDSVTRIGGGAFSYCYRLTSITIPDGVTSIGNSAFYSCKALTTIRVPENPPYDVTILQNGNSATIEYYKIKTESGIPYSLIKEKVADNIELKQIFDDNDGDYEAVVAKEAANGKNTIGECLIAGISPTEPDAAFEVSIEIVNGEPVITYTPDLNEGGTKQERVYTIEGCAELGGEWKVIESDADKEGLRFFRVRVALP